MPWSKADIEPRVKARLEILGKTIEDILPGYAFFAASKQGSPTIDILERLADGLGWSLCELLCGLEMRDDGPQADLMEWAVAAALDAIPSDRQELLADAIVDGYRLLLAYRQEGRSIDESALAMLRSVLRGKAR